MSCAKKTRLWRLALFEGLRLLEDDALGGGGSRGSGRVRFANLKLTWRSRAFYSSGGDEAELASARILAAVQSAGERRCLRGEAAS